MGTFTAQILVGYSGSYDGGITPTHYMFLSENSRPGWVLSGQNIFPNPEQSFSNVIWIPTLENMLEDALLMIALHVVKNKEIIDMAKGMTDNIMSEKFEMYEHLDENQRNRLYKKCRELKNFPKISLTVFEGSHLYDRLQLLEKYNMDVEVCKPTYSRLSSAFDEEKRIKGSL